MSEGLQLKDFNRYFLRYGPNTAVTAIGAYILSSEVRVFLESGSVAKLIVFIIAAIAIGYLFTWPMLLAHLFRAKPAEIEAYAKYRDANNGKEFIDTVRHAREYANALICAGATWLQMCLFAWFMEHGIEFRQLMLPFVFIVAGWFAWHRAMELEKLQK